MVQRVGLETHNLPVPPSDLATTKSCHYCCPLDLDAQLVVTRRATRMQPASAEPGTGVGVKRKASPSPPVVMDLDAPGGTSSVAADPHRRPGAAQTDPALSAIESSLEKAIKSLKEAGEALDRAYASGDGERIQEAAWEKGSAVAVVRRLQDVQLHLLQLGPPPPSGVVPILTADRLGASPEARHSRSSSPDAATADAMRAFLSTVEFPTNAGAFELPELELDPSNEYAASIKQAGVVRDWLSESARPDFLMTRLDRKLVDLRYFEWDDLKKQLSAGYQKGPVRLPFTSPASQSISCIVSASGTGKTRYILQRCYDQWGLYLTCRTGISQPGSTDFSTFLGNLPNVLAGPAAVDAMGFKIREHVRRILLARLLVLEAARTQFPDLQPKHWLILQLFPAKIVGLDVFSVLANEVGGPPLVGLSKSMWVRSGLQFVALDEAQSADKLLPDTFVSAESGTAQSALSPLVKELCGVRTNILLSGTGLTSYELASSSAAKHDVEPTLLGTTTHLDEDGVRAALAERGVTPPADSAETIKLFVGRPRFAMRLAEALLLQEDASQMVAEKIVKFFQKQLDTRLRTISADAAQTTNTVYGQLRFAAREWVLRGRGAIIRGGEVALEAGVCALEIAEVDGDSGACAFVIKEPLVIRAFSDLPEAEFEDLSNEKPSVVGYMAEDYVALNAIQLCSMLSNGPLVNLLGSQLGEAHLADFLGEWTLAIPDASQRRGTLCRDGEEPAQIRHILQCAGEVGRSIVFPGNIMGADLVVAAKRPIDGRKLLIFAQVKSSFRASTPAAFRSLELPYHVNRDGPGTSVSKNHSIQAAYDDLNTIVCGNLSVVFLVFKYPGKSHTTQPVVYNYHGKPVLKLTLDGSNARDLLPGMAKGFDALDVIRWRKDVFSGVEE